MKKLTLAMAVISVLLLAGCGGTKGQLGFAKPDFQKAPPELMAKIVNAGDAFKYPDANSIAIEVVDSTIFNEDGSAINYSYALSKPLTPQGLKDESSLELSYDNQMMELDVFYAMIIHQDSTIYVLPDSEIIDQVASEGMAEADIYWTNLRKKVVHLPQLYPGDAVAVSYRYKMLKPYFENVISGTSGFQGTEPIHLNRSVSLIPKSKAGEIKHRILNDTQGWVKFRQYETGNYVAFVWQADSVPSFVPEPGMPSPTKFIPLVMFSNVSWQELSKKAFDITEPPMLIKDPEIDKTIATIVEGCKTEMDSIRAIGLWVAQDIRYVGLSLGDKEGVTPHNVNETFDARAGVCKDKSALAVAMLRRAGFEAYNVLTNPMAHVVYDIATNQFNHQIVVVKTRKGEEVFIDVTDDICRDLLPGYYSKKATLTLTGKGEDLKYFPVIPADKNKGTIRATTKIDSLGNLTSKLEIDGIGLYDEVTRQLGQYLEKEDQKKFFRQYLSQIDPNAKLVAVKLEPDPIKDLEKPTKITIEYEIPEYAVAAGDFMLLTIPNAQHVFDLLAGTIGENLKLDERKYPVEFMFTFASDIEEVVELAAKYQPKSIPDPKTISNKYFDYNVSYNINNNVVQYKSSLKLKDVEIPLKDYADFKKAYADYKSTEKSMLVLNKFIDKDIEKKTGTKPATKKSSK